MIITAKAQDEGDDGPREEKKEEKTPGIYGDQDCGSSRNEACGAEVAPEHPRSRGAHDFEQTVANSDHGEAQCVIGPANRAIRETGPAKPIEAGPILLRLIELLIERMMISHVVYLIKLEWHTIGKEAYPTKEFVQETLAENTQMRMVMLHKVHLPQEHENQEEGIPGPAEGKCGELHT
jgi:hypothetical protein